MATELWTDRRHATYEEARKRRLYARDHFTGDVYEKALKAAKSLADVDLRFRFRPEEPEGTVIRIDHLKAFTSASLGVEYLHPRAQGEAGLAFYERAKISRYPNHMATLVESFVGGVFAVERNAAREYGEPLGLPTDTESVLYALHRDIDGTGINWNTRLTEKSADFIVDGVVWYLADRIEEEGPIRIYCMDPDSVVNWVEQDGRLTEVLVQEIAEEQDTLHEEPQTSEYYTHYTLDGWTRYVVAGEGEDRHLEVVGAGAWLYPFYTAPDKVRPRLPIGRVSLPIKRPIGYQMAHDANHLYNLLSDARWLYRVLNHPRLRGNVDDGVWSKVMDWALAGGNALQGDWDYISPPAENAASAHQTYREEVREFYIANHQRANQSAIERSATEVLFNEAAGRTAFLSLLAGAVDELENEWLFLASQMEAPTKPETWLNATVERSRDFKPIDVERIADQRSTRFATYASILPTDMALEISGHDRETVEKFRDYNPVPEEEMFNGSTRDEGPGSAAPPAGDGAGLGVGGLEATLAGIADGLGGGA